MNFQELRQANVQRCNQSYHPFSDWKPWDWSNALAGECGEACNLTKKLRRTFPSGEYPPQTWRTNEKLEDDLADEIADVVIYADLLAASIGRTLEDIIRFKFNQTSEKIGSSVKL